ncbi:TPA: phosphate acyltransferase [Streptococcus agalactiae]
MKFEYIAEERCKVKTLLKSHDVSRGLLAKIKYRGGKIFVNGEEQNAIFLLEIGDVVTIDIPDEPSHETLEPVPHDLDIVYEDDHFLILNKPFGFASIPSSIHSNTIANFIKHYYVSNNYANQQVHIVTRLDRDTSGLMLFAKHGYAHARLDKQLQAKAIEKRYYALVSGSGDLADSGDIIAPNAQELAEIAVNTADTAKIFDIDPKIAMLSFSTKGSAKAPQAEKVQEAAKIAKDLSPELAVDGELQFDAAFVPETAEIKAPNSDVAGKANVFIFPDLQSGNIGYKIAQRLGMFEAIGPILQGLNAPVNDLSRGSSAEDIYKLAIITAAQAIDEKSK